MVQAFRATWPPVQAGRVSRRALLASASLAMPLAGAQVPLAGPTASPGLTPTDIVVGQILTLDAGRNDTGVAVRQGVAAALAVVQANGSIHGRRISLRVLDDQGDPARAEALAEQLLAQGVFLLFGPTTAGPSRALMAWAQAREVPLVAPMAGLWPPFMDDSGLVLPVRAHLGAELHTLMAQARGLGMERTALLHLADAAGQSPLALARALAQQQGLPQPLSLPARPGQTEAEWLQLAARARDQGIDLVINAGDGVLPFDRLVRAVRQTGQGPACWGVSTGASEVVRRLGGLAAGMRFTQVVPDPTLARSEWVREYQAAFRASFRDQAFSHASLEAYWSVRALADGLRAAGPGLTRQRLRMAWAESPPERPPVDTALVTAQGQWRH